MAIKKKTYTFGTCSFARISPDQITPTTKVINVVLPFEDALKLNIGVLECVRKLNSYNRATKAGRDAALVLTISLGQKRIAVNEDHV